MQPLVGEDLRVDLMKTQSEWLGNNCHGRETGENRQTWQEIGGGNLRKPRIDLGCSSIPIN